MLAYEFVWAYFASASASAAKVQIVKDLPASDDGVDIWEFVSAETQMFESELAFKKANTLHTALKASFVSGVPCLDVLAKDFADHADVLAMQAGFYAFRFDGRSSTKRIIPARP